MSERFPCRGPLALTLLLLLGACGREGDTPRQTPPAPAKNVPSQAQARPAAPEIAMPKPEAASGSGIDRGGMDDKVKPGDDFNAYANGTWARTTHIADDLPAASTFQSVYERAEQRTAELIQSLGQTNPAAGSNERKIADFHTAYMDEAGIEKSGLTALKPQLEAIDKINDVASLSRYLGADLRADVDPLNATHFHTERLFGLFVAQGLDDPERNVAYLLQGGLGMPDREYYLADSRTMAGYRARYQAYIEATFTRMGVNKGDAPLLAKDVMALETRIARAHASIIDSQDVRKANNPWTRTSFSVKAPGMDWATYFKAAGLAEQETIVAWQPAAIRDLSMLVGSQPLRVWKHYLRFHAINQSAPTLPRAYSNAAFVLFEKTLQGTPQQPERWKRAVSATNAALGDAIGQLYVKHYFPPASKAQVEQMVQTIQNTFVERVDSLDWMTIPTREKAKAKAKAMLVGVGYPERWRDYTALEIKPDDATGNILRAQQARHAEQLAKLGKPVDRNEWWMTPQTVNAVQLPLQNAMNFPAAILEAPFFDPKADSAANYGAIGAVIGHEISHGFDNTGAQFDAQGRLDNWWTPRDAAHFKAIGQRLARQFDAYEPLRGVHINGTQTLGENMADVAGLAVAYAAWQTSLNGKPAPQIDGMSGEQRFFLAYAQAWRTKTRDAALRAQLVGGTHAPGRYRAQTVRNIDTWYDAFQVSPDDTLYLAPKDRIRLW